MGILVENVTKRFQGKPFLNNISLAINDGDFVTLLGPTGAGKTTLMRIMAGIEQPNSGKVYYDNQDVTDMPVQRRNIAMVYQQFINYPSMTIYDNIASPLRVAKAKHSREEIDRKVKETAELMGLSGVLEHYPQEVSGGQQQRTAIARALSKGTKFMFLDEPLVNLDYKLREELRGELKRIFRSQGGAVVYATPEPVDALSMATHVAYMQDGEILQFGPVRDVYHNPQSIDVGAYFSHPTMNMFDCRLVSQNGRVALQASEELTLDVTPLRDQLDKQEYVLGIHAHALSTIPDDKHTLPIKANVELSEVVGSDTELHLSHQQFRLIVLMQKFVSYEIGEEIEVYLDPDRFFIYEKDSRQLVAKTFFEDA
jgi:glycerol transport system ATP-binding protein